MECRVVEHVTGPLEALPSYPAWLHVYLLPIATPLGIPRTDDTPTSYYKAHTLFLGSSRHKIEGSFCVI